MSPKEAIIDRAVRTLSRRVHANPGDREGAETYRAALLRLAWSSPEEAHPLLTDLEGALCSLTSTVVDLSPPELRRELPRWRRVNASGGRSLLPPRIGEGDLEERWRADGIACWLSEGIALLEAPDRSLEARDAETGALLWSVPSVALARGSLDDDERAESLPWAVAPWGAVEVCARFQAPLLYGRVGRDRRREVTGRGEGEVEVTLQILLAQGGCWPRSQALPEVVVEHAEPGQALCDTELRFESYEDSLLELSLDPASRSFGLCGMSTQGGAPPDWTIFRVGGGRDVPGHVGPAGWTPEDPFEPERAPPAERVFQPLDGERASELISERLVRVEGEAAPVSGLPAAGLLFAQVADESLVALGAARAAGSP